VKTALHREDGQPVVIGGMEKMSKSKNNGVDPQALIERFGADTARLFTMFAAPPDLSLEWSDSGVEGAHRFIKRLWRAVHEHVGGESPGALDTDALDDAGRELRRKLHDTIAKVTDDIGRRQTFNTAVAANMELLNDLGKFPQDAAGAPAVRQEALEGIVRMLAPIIPHVTETLWRTLGHDELVAATQWPQVDEAARQAAQETLAVQVNGKRRAEIAVPSGADKDAIETVARNDENVQRHIEGQDVIKVIVVPGRLVNFVVKPQ